MRFSLLVCEVQPVSVCEVWYVNVSFILLVFILKVYCMMMFLIFVVVVVAVVLVVVIARRIVVVVVYDVVIVILDDVAAVVVVINLIIVTIIALSSLCHRCFLYLRQPHLSPPPHTHTHASPQMFCSL